MQYNSENAYSAIELIMAVACIGLLTAAALPAWQHLHSEQRLIEATETFVRDLRSARSLTLLHNRRYYLHYDTAAQHNSNGDDWCYTLASEPDCHCLNSAVAPACLALPDRHRHWQRSATFAGIHLSEVVFGGDNNVSFNPVRGTASFGHLRLADEYNRALIINVSLLGRIRVCHPAGSAATGSYPAC
jgi:type IV fimbrial biogenesis protein FimT